MVWDGGTLYKSDCSLFNATTKITIGNGAKASFWHSAWWNGECPKDVAPLIFQINSRKNRTVQQALTENNWVRDINLLRFDTVHHFIQFTRLWQGLQEVELNPEIQDQITWKLTTSGEHTARSEYLGTSNFAWLAIQNRVWTADRLAARGCPNQQYCPICMSTNESAIHLFAHCRYSKRIWEAIRSWTNGKFPRREGWNNMDSVGQWWHTVGTSSPCKAVRSMTLLVTWELWRERNARIF